MYSYVVAVNRDVALEDEHFLYLLVTEISENSLNQSRLILPLQVLHKLTSTGGNLSTLRETNICTVLSTITALVIDSSEITLLSRDCLSQVQNPEDSLPGSDSNIFQEIQTLKMITEQQEKELELLEKESLIIVQKNQDLKKNLEKIQIQNFQYGQDEILKLEAQQTQYKKKYKKKNDQVIQYLLKSSLEGKKKRERQLVRESLSQQLEEVKLEIERKRTLSQQQQEQLELYQQRDLVGELERAKEMFLNYKQLSFNWMWWETLEKQNGLNLVEQGDGRMGLFSQLVRDSVPHDQWPHVIRRYLENHPQ
eukprot:TRINITY_DN14361_c0_g1_i2.p1 TRINITY_DN14361_c0_g1~~TRINITY_DN14361_c0_g1_i2.p1  ORF type:complete len:309 (-),score=91.17 TRINITY_DN14361_c0_g1_i2:95-1021(-)